MSSHLLARVEQRTMQRQWYADCSCGEAIGPRRTQGAATTAHTMHTLAPVSLNGNGGTA